MPFVGKGGQPPIGLKQITRTSLLFFELESFQNTFRFIETHKKFFTSS